MESIQAFVTSPWVGFAVGALVLVLGSKMSAELANVLLVVAWAILVVSVFRTPLLSPLAPIPRVLFTMLAAAGIGLALYYTLWTKTGKLGLGFEATTTAHTSPFRTPVPEDMEWSPHFAELKVTIWNNSKLDYTSIDLVVTPDVPVSSGGDLSQLTSATVVPHDPNSLEAAALFGTGEQHPFVFLASSRGQRVRAEMLPAKSSLEVLFATVTVNDGEAANPEDRVLRLGFPDGSALWFAHPNHTEGVFGPRPAPREVSITGTYRAGGRKRSVSERLDVYDPLGSIMDMLRSKGDGT